jgi:hypothetical protein
MNIGKNRNNWLNHINRNTKENKDKESDLMKRTSESNKIMFNKLNLDTNLMYSQEEIICKLIDRIEKLEQELFKI